MTEQHQMDDYYEYNGSTYEHENEEAKLSQFKEGIQSQHEENPEREKDAAASHKSGHSNKNKRKDPNEDETDILIKFDADPVYGPCKSIGRLQRWLNAERLGLNPPLKVREAIEESGLNDSYLEQFFI
ncbi:hypothetical protein FGO68_gene5182 [Halteria grandinella]|uniref:DNA polymerase delta subunit 4 n=1 Tax=Halteria grandinella TaxID=5974 RepID=A0A8J8NIY4_HALGN|nr:hypothetical protein FGO68_gene5182 [Halteria grandinella]